jgi:hypothetical protein
MSGFSPVRFLRAFIRNSPWAALAIMIHVVIFAIMGVIKVVQEIRRTDDVVTTVAIAAKKEEAEPFVPPPEVIDRKAVPKNEEAEIVAYEHDVTFIPMDKADEENLTLERGDPTAMDLPNRGTTGGTAIGAGEGPGHRGTGTPSAYAGRRLGTAGKGRAGGPTQGTEKAVLEGLRWLIRHQNPDGSWSAQSLKSRCNEDKNCLEHELYKDDKFTANFDEGLTGLALLAFLGAGYNFDSKQDIVDTVRAKKHKMGEVIKNGLLWLKKRQKPDGSFGAERAFMYNEALATLALCEAYGLSNKHRHWQECAQKGVDFLVAAQRPRPAAFGDGLWGWRYASRLEVENELRAKGSDIPKDWKGYPLYDSDISVTCWVTMALKSAAISGLNVPKESLEGALAFARYVTEKKDDKETGRVGYLHPDQAGVAINGTWDHFKYHTPVMGALGCLVRIFVEKNEADPFFEVAAKTMAGDLPALPSKDGVKDRLGVDYYYWYHGSLALNQLDGPDSPRKSGKYWDKWNKAMNDTVMALQENTDERLCRRGGWLAPDRWCHAGGPIYATAINVLTLEVYYRYENAFGGAKRGALQAPPEKTK